MSSPSDLLSGDVRLQTLSDAELLAAAAQVVELQKTDRQENQLRYYVPANDTIGQLHVSLAKTIGIGGGNGAGKTDHALVEVVIRATGQIPDSLKSIYPRSKLRGPIRGRVICESLTTTLAPIILPKLQYWQWSGVGQPGSTQGHWGWIPRNCLIGGEWSKSWTERTRLLRLYYRDPDDPDRIMGESLIQFMSYDQDPSDFASGDCHIILHDEPPKYDIWRESRARVMRVDGTILLSMTWPDDPSIPVDWIFDQVYDKSRPGSEIEWINIYTTDNPHLNQKAVAHRAGEMSEQERAVRIYGQPIRFSNRIHPLFTDQVRQWCYRCGIEVMVDDDRLCTRCNGDDIVPFTHVVPVLVVRDWPCIYVLDPHPRKPHMMLWAQVDPNDDVHVIHHANVPGGVNDVRTVVEDIEAEYGWHTIRRLIDPNMGRSPSGASREITWQDEFAAVGIVCDLANDSEVGRQRVNDYLKPDPRTRRPRLSIDGRCDTAILQMKRYVWDEYKMSDRDIKQSPKLKYDDYPTMLKYLLNSDPSFRGVLGAGQVFTRATLRRNGY